MDPIVVNLCDLGCQTLLVAFKLDILPAIVLFWMLEANY